MATLQCSRCGGTRYDTNHRCEKGCGVMTAKDEVQSLRERLEKVEAERDALASHAEAVADAIGLPAHNENRLKTGVVSASIENAIRFADYLHAVEREFLMAPGEPDDDYPNEEPDDECQVNSWGAKSEDHYVKQFRQALARRDARVKAETLEDIASRPIWCTVYAAKASVLEIAETYRQQAEEVRHDG